MTELEKKMSREEFKLALRQLLATRQRLDRQAMADLFRDDGDLGTQMRNTLLAGKNSAPPPPDFIQTLDQLTEEAGATGTHGAAQLERHRRRWNLYRRGG